MMAETGCGDAVILPLPIGTVLPPNPACGTGLDDIADRGIEWLKGLLN